MAAIIELNFIAELRMMRCLWIVLLLCLTQRSSGQCSDSVINCTGECGQFTDTDKDGFCDDSIHDTATIFEKAANIANIPPADAGVEIKESPGIITNTATDASEPVKTTPTRAVTVQPTAEQKQKRLATETPLAPAEQKQIGYLPQKETKAQNSGQHRHGNRYDYAFLSVALPLIAAWAILQLLSAKKIIRRSVFLRIWNSALLLSFLVSALLGLVITAKLVYGFALPGIKTIYTLHVDFGVAMAVISIFHLVIHWKYYRNILRG
ncbi:MAG TPA: DUF4405 domain-containing protein [Chitinophagaceae bacterium]